ncbi:hypothetical protein K435DRAFT_876637 [Dendrothele bispora CBS 962.96]|uniref:Uncharacterized protein n=1 Tax=Dendrothele bispora (strain CBS 962.96) TaxID=1314807 RepID=A0A4S8KRM8_DENBC|nr:hypothetical protein K435DRAFT_876637 [Dendrothele bispora CBS 962.96]
MTVPPPFMSLLPSCPSSIHVPPPFMSLLPSCPSSLHVPPPFMPLLKQHQPQRCVHLHTRLPYHRTLRHLPSNTASMDYSDQEDTPTSSKHAHALSSGASKYTYAAAQWYYRIKSLYMSISSVFCVVHALDNPDDPDIEYMWVYALLIRIYAMLTLS